MLRYLRTRPIHRRLLYQSGLPANHLPGIHTTQRVRFVKPVITKRRIGTLIGFGLAYYAFSEILSLTIEEEEEEEEEDQLRKKKPDLLITEEVHEPLFIPMGWPKKLPKTFYRGTDPEWQSFLKLNKTPGEEQSLRNELCRLVTAGALSQDARLRKTLGKPATWRKAWLEIEYPDGPPQEYEWSGIEIGDDYLAWTTKPVSSRNVARLKHSLYPMSTISSIWSSWSTLATLQSARFRRLFNMDEGSEEKNSLPSVASSGRLLKSSDSHRSSAVSAEQSDLGTDASLLKQDTSKGARSASNQESQKIGGNIPRLPAVPTVTGDMKEAILAGRRTFAKTWKPPKGDGDFAPRGSFIIWGWIELRGPKGGCILEILSSYHPVERQWKAIAWKVRSLKLASQRPKGK